MTQSLPFCVEMPSITPASAPGHRPRLWPTGTQLHVSFLDGARELQEKVAQVAQEWSTYAHLRFVFNDQPGAEIRVTFDTAGLWSYVGTDALDVPPDRPTVGLGALSKRNLRGAVLHVFGHVLGFGHEHQNPVTGIPWDKEKLYAYLAGAYGWTPQQVNEFILTRYEVSAASHTLFDPRSIMLMPVPAELTHGSFAIGWNTALAETDKSYAAQCYPMSAAMASPFEAYIGGGVATGGASFATPDAGQEDFAAVPGAGTGTGSGSSSGTGSGTGTGTGAGLEALGIPKGLVEEKIRLDVATPQSVVIDEPFDLAVAVVRPDAPPLAIEDLPAVSVEEGTVFRPGAEEVIRYRIGVTGANCDVSPPAYTILLRPGEDSKPRYFQVTPHKPGKCTLVVNAYQEEDILAAQTRVRIEVQVPVRTQPTLPSQEHEEPVVDIVLSPAEIRQFKEALLSAFQRAELEQVVFFGVEVRLDTIVSRSTYDKEVADLVIWTNDNNKVGALLQEARRVNPGNVKLRDFAGYIQAKQSGAGGAAASANPFAGLKPDLLNELIKLSVTESALGRTSLLDGIPGAETLNRDAGNRRLDLDLIVTQLAQRGRLANGQLPLVKFISNALPYAAGFEGETKLQSIQQSLQA